MMTSKRKNVYYLIEPIDIDGDNNHDGILISKYKLDKNFNKIFIKNKFITFKDFNQHMKKFKSHINKKEKGGAAKSNEPEKEIVYVRTLNDKEYNNFMNNNYPPPHQYPPHAYQQPYPQQPPPYGYPYPYQQPPPVAIHPPQNDNGGFLGNVGSGLGLGLGVGFGASAGEALFDGIGEMF
jgi:hypothetical protein